MLLWLGKLFSNLRGNVAIRGMLSNIKGRGWLQWLSNELAPASYTTPGAKLTLGTFLPEVFGWSKHIVLSFLFTMVYQVLVNAIATITTESISGSIKGILFNVQPFSKVLLITVVITFVIEIIEFIAAQASFINPVNSLLDILFYVLGAWLFFVAMGL